MLACRTGGLEGRERNAYTSAEGERSPPVVTPLFMLYHPLKMMRELNNSIYWRKNVSSNQFTNVYMMQTVGTDVNI